MEAEKFYAAFEQSNNGVAERWFNRESLFDTNFSQYPDTMPEVCAKEVAQLYAGFILTQFTT